jgi:ATP-dependent DNA helicase RecG
MVDLATDIKYLKGVGPKRAKLMNRLGIGNVYELLRHFPKRYMDRTQITPIGRTTVGENATVLAKVQTAGSRDTRKRRKIFTLLVADESGMLECVWFGQPWLSKTFRRDDWVLLSGKVDFYRGRTMTHPDFEIISEKEEEELLNTGRIVPVYPLTEGLNQRTVRRLVKTALDLCLEQLPDTLTERSKGERELLRLRQAVANIHFPESYSLKDLARKTLVYEEFFYLQILLALRRSKFKKNPGIAFTAQDQLPRQLLANLGITLTNAQKRCLDEISGDMSKSEPMNRLLQGEVGSGKTLIATCAALMAITDGYQSAIMAPTEILANQHYRRISSLLDPIGLSVALLIGGQRMKERDRILEQLKAGEIDLIIGTHALIEETVQFRSLGLVIVDEQHRFGVMQRAALRKKGVFPDFLVMTATPIPRTLSLTLYGDLDISVLDELPHGKRDVVTRLTTDAKREKVYGFVREKLRGGSQAFVVYPLVEESEKLELKAAKEMYNQLRTIFPEYEVGLIHGRIGSDEKESVMRGFRSGHLQILVSTTVIEVGVDVPNADIMLIEHAERYGLAQLHQLRGRIGRGGTRAYCILIPSASAGDDARERLRALEETDDGFRISEVDLKLRGPGEIYGTRQHGLPELKIADLIEDQHLLKQAREDAFDVVASDPSLSHPDNSVIASNLRRRKLDWIELASVG